MKMEIYEDKSSQWRWRLSSSNGRIIADSAESYTRREDAKRAAADLVNRISIHADEIEWKDS